MTDRLDSDVTRGEALMTIHRRLAQAGMDAPAREARLLLAHALGLSQAELIAKSDHTLGATAERVAGWLAARAGGMPLARLVGEKEFYGLSFALSPETLVPRPETELLVEHALAWLTRPERAGQALRALDIGTGSGCILIALAKSLPMLTGLGTDLSAGALDTARANAERHGLSGRLTFVQADGAAGLNGTFDIILSNPPYIPSGEMGALPTEVREHDPALALDGGTDGLDIYRALLPQVRTLLSDAGLCLLEHGAGQGAALARLAGAAGLTVTARYDDLSGHDRIVAVQKAAQSA